MDMNTLSKCNNFFIIIYNLILCNIFSGVGEGVDLGNL